MCYNGTVKRTGCDNENPMKIRVGNIVRGTRKGRFRLFRGQTGFTLIEVLVAVVILAAIGVAILQGLDTVSRSTRINDEKAVAGNLATEHLEAIKGMPYAATYPGAGGNITIPFQYSVAINTTFSDNGTTWVDTYTGQTLQKIVVSVSREGRPVLSICTLRAKR